jgi:peptidyl-tRNA hydrolase
MIEYNRNVGGLISNATHAAISVIIENSQDKDTNNYTGTSALPPATQMHSVVLAANDQTELEQTVDKLKQNNIIYKVWIEQPENYPSCLATKPYQRKIIQPILKHLKLFR